MWPFRKRETRSTGAYTEALIASLVASADGASTAFPSATGALEAAAGFVGRAFASADVQASPAIAAVLDPACRALIGRSLIRDGDLVMLIRVDIEGGLRLIPARSYDVTGGPEPESWTYRVTAGGPTRLWTIANVPAESIVHVRYAVDPAATWRGISPVTVASLAGKLSAETASALADESGMPRGAFLPLPVDGNDPTIGGLKKDIAAAAGRLLTVEAGDWDNAGTGRAAGWQAERFGASPPDALVELHKTATTEIFAASGIPPGIFDASQAAAARESYRQFLFGTIAPLGRLVEAELRAKLDEPGLTLVWDELRAADIAGRARAFQSMVGGGMDPTKAAALSGLMIPDEADG